MNVESKYRFVIDAGNTRIKLGIFKDERLISQNAFAVSDEKSFKQIIYVLQQTEKKFFSGLISSVTQLPDYFLTELKQNYEIIIFDFNTPLPFENGYESLETLGTDRLASMAAVWKLFQGQSSMVINAGTAITYDYMSSIGKYLGGAISPGLSMRFKALNTFTSRLPLIKPENDSLPALIGLNTTDCIRSGVQLGILMEIKSVIETWRNQSEHNIHAIICGGNSNLFVTQLKSSIFALRMEWLPDLVLIGLNSILTFNDV